MERAKEARREAEERRPEVDQATSKLREIRLRNHFAEMFQASVEGHRR